MSQAIKHELTLLEIVKNIGDEVKLNKFNVFGVIVDIS